MDNELVPDVVNMEISFDETLNCSEAQSPWVNVVDVTFQFLPVGKSKPKAKSIFPSAAPPAPQQNDEFSQFRTPSGSFLSHSLKFFTFSYFHCSHMERGPKFFKMGTKRGPDFE